MTRKEAQARCQVASKAWIESLGGIFGLDKDRQERMTTSYETGWLHSWLELTKKLDHLRATIVDLQALATVKSSPTATTLDWVGDYTKR